MRRVCETRRLSPAFVVVFASLALGLGLGLLVLTPRGVGATDNPDADAAAGELGPADTRSRSPAVFPPQSIELDFAHSRHLDLGLECVDCHAEATTSVRTADRLLPAMEVCLQCHDLGGEPAPESDLTIASECQTCHPTFRETPPQLPSDVETLDQSNFRRVLNPPPRPEIPPANLHFSHRLHVDADIACTTCHGNLAEQGLATRANLPTMADCLDCHGTLSLVDMNDTTVDVTEQQCQTCHLSGPDGRLKTQFASGALAPKGRFRPDDHRLDFVETHAEVAAADPDHCDTCHTEDMCADCHDGVAKPMAIHPANYVMTHGIDARQSPDDCESCHTRTDFCLGCHEQTGVGDANRPPLGTRHHPEGFVADIDSPNFHAEPARRNLAACTACHQESTCIGCHAGINPHPPSFFQRCGAMLERNATACSKCHGNVDALELICQ